jgi:hypothetical protein
LTSQINPNNINGSYPVAGQDNNSQGFRDNFTNTVTNFTYAAEEITELQNNAVLKAPLSGTTLNNNMNGSVLSNAQLQDMSFTVVSLGTLSGSVSIDYSAGHFQTVTTGGPILLSFINLPTNGIAGTVTVSITVANIAHTVSLPATVSVNNVGIQGLNPVTNSISFASTGVYAFEFTTTTNGTTFTVNQVNEGLQPFNNSSEDLSSGGACSLGVTTEYFATSAATFATLGAGVNGQIKTLAMSGYGGNMTVTVSIAGWNNGSAGNIVFNEVGQACILQFINGAWYCIGNNGATFS